MRLKDKVCIITGGSQGLGKEMAELFAKEGAKVIACSRSHTDYESANINWYKLDVTDKLACEQLAKHVERQYGQVDVLINNAGITKDALTRKMSEEQWDTVMDVNLKGVFNLTRHIGPMMQVQGSGSIINISSVVGEFGNIGQANYAATKAGIYGLTKSWAKEFSMKGAQVRVNAISPGYTMTDILKTVPEDLLDKFAKQTMLGRIGDPLEIANAALFLASDESSYITGHNLSVNGGMRL